MQALIVEEEGDVNVDDVGDSINKFLALAGLESCKASVMKRFVS